LVTALTGAFAIGSEGAASDLVAGVSLFIAKPYSPGDLVKLANFEGKVEHITLIMTRLVGIDGDHIFIRNSEVTRNAIVNYSSQKGQLISVNVPVPPMEDLDKAIEAVMEAIQDFSPELSNSDLQPSVVCDSMAFGYIIMEVRVYVTERLDYGPEKTRLFTKAVRALKDAGIQIKL
jgi:small-conductance mechanosensitive channel